MRPLNPLVYIQTAKKLESAPFIAKLKSYQESIEHKLEFLYTSSAKPEATHISNISDSKLWHKFSGPRIALVIKDLHHCGDITVRDSFKNHERKLIAKVPIGSKVGVLYLTENDTVLGDQINKEDTKLINPQSSNDVVCLGKNSPTFEADLKTFCDHFFKIVQLAPADHFGVEATNPTDTPASPLQ